MEWLQDRPFLVAIVAGTGAQFLKVVTFLIAERRVNYRRFVQTDGAPNMHSTAFSALACTIGLRDGFHSLGFALALCLMAIVMVDTLNVKNATSRQKEAILLLLDRLRRREGPVTAGRNTVSYTPMDVFMGTGLGVLFSVLIA